MRRLSFWYTAIPFKFVDWRFPIPQALGVKSPVAVLQTAPFVLWVAPIRAPDNHPFKPASLARLVDSQRVWVWRFALLGTHFGDTV